MCGIFGCHNYSGDISAYRSRALALSKRLRHRGPDWSGCFMSKDSILCHERLAIVGVDTGAQPLVSEDGKLALCVNGEIYNHRALARALKTPLKTKPKSDCEVILHLYREHGPELVGMLDGMFSFILLDTSVHPSRMIVARDPIGITTLYHGFNSSHPSTVYFASELKALHEECDRLQTFPPGHIYDSQTGKIERYFRPSWWNGDIEAGSSKDYIPAAPVDLTLLRKTLEKSVKKRLMSEVPYGVLLSGGLDSSLIAAIAARETDKVAQAQAAVARGRSTSATRGGVRLPKANGIASSIERGADTLKDTLPGIDDEAVARDADEGDESTLTAWPRLHSFSIGLPGAPDLVAARKAAEYLGTVHHEYTFTVQEGLDAVPDVIYHLETYDVTTVRASTPMYLLSRKIKAMGVKMVLSGEGSDEIFGGYLYFHAAPSAADFHRECVRRVKNLHTSDCLRANKSTMAWGLEARVPFLDKEFLDVAMSVRPDDKVFGKGREQKVDADGRPIMEKYILRKAFDCAPGGVPYLPDEVLWRQKEQFSDGVGYSWIDGLKAHAEAVVSDEQLSKAGERWKVDAPETKEAYYIREAFEHHFPTEAAAGTAKRWVPTWQKSTDPSGRSVEIHNAAYDAAQPAA